MGRSTHGIVPPHHHDRRLASAPSGERGGDFVAAVAFHVASTSARAHAFPRVGSREERFSRMTTAAIRRFAIPSPEELIERARRMVPEIRALAEETERNRNVLLCIIDKIRDAGLLRTCRPKEFGGFEYEARWHSGSRSRSRRRALPPAR